MFYSAKSRRMCQNCWSKSDVPRKRAERNFGTFYEPGEGSNNKEVRYE